MLTDALCALRTETSSTRDLYTNDGIENVRNYCIAIHSVDKDDEYISDHQKVGDAFRYSVGVVGHQWCLMN
jgi:hypothetical protein